MSENKHHCRGDRLYGPYGSIDDPDYECYENDQGEFWATMGEYSGQVNYCPFCGVKAPVQLCNIDKDEIQ